MPDAKSRRHGIRFPQCGARGMRITVTGAYGFSGKYMAQRLLALRHEVITLTNSPHRSNPFGESVKAFLYNFSEPKELEKSLRGIDVLINTYWVRFDKPSHFTDAIGPETFYYRDMVEMIAREIGSRALIVPMPPMLAYQCVRVLGWVVGDVINTRDEVRGLMQERLYVESPPLGTTKLSDWVRASRQDIGRQYASELQRRLGRDSTYRRK